MADDIALGSRGNYGTSCSRASGEMEMLRQAEHAAHSLAQLSNALAQLLKAEPGSSHEPERSDASQPPVEPDSRVAAQ